MKKRILSMLLAVVMVVGLLPATVLGVSANTGLTIPSGSFASTEGKWNSAGTMTKNLITTPTLPSLSNGEGKDKSGWKNNWNNVMVPAGWGSSGISGDDDALQVFSHTTLDGEATFAIRPVDGGGVGSDACLGDMTQKWVNGGYTYTVRRTGISYTVKLDDNAVSLANGGNLTTSAKAEFYRQKSCEYIIGITIEFYNAEGNVLSAEDATPSHSSDLYYNLVDTEGVYYSWDAQSGKEDGYLSRYVSKVKVPAGTAYIRYWFANWGTGNDRKAVKNLTVVLTNTSNHTHSWDSDWSYDDSYHWHECTVDGCAVTENSGKNGYAAHSYTNNICSCGRIKQNSTGNTAEAPPEHTHESVTYTAVSGDIGSVSGNVYLFDNATATDDITITGTVNLCLNGKKLDMGAKTLKVESGATLNICDCQSGGIITSTNTNCVRNDGTLNVLGGTVQGNGNRGIFNYGTVTMTGGTVESSAGGGKAISTGGDSGVLNMTGGTVKTTGSNSNSYAISLTGGVVNLSGGTVTSTNGYGIFVSGDNSTLYLSGSPTVNYNASYSTISYTSGAIYAKSADGSTAYTGGAMTVYSSSNSLGKVVINNVTAGNKDKFTLYGDTYVLALGTGANSDDLVIAEALVPHTHGETVYTKWTATSGTVASGNYYLSGNVTATGNITIADGETVTLCLNSHTLNLNGNSIKVSRGGTLNLYDCSAGGSGKITTATSDDWAAAVDVSGTYNQYGGTVENTSTNKTNSAVCAYIANQGVINISGGKAIGPRGVTVYQSGTLNVSGTAYIEGVRTNDDSYCGIYMYQGGKATVSGGTVKGYTAIYTYRANNTPELEISGTAKIIATGSYGEGILNGGILKVSGGEISGKYGIVADASTETYLTGTPNITGTTASIEMGSSSASIYGSYENAAYQGDLLTVQIPSNLALGDTVVYGTTDTKKFTLVNTDDYVLKADGGNLVLAEKVTTPDYTIYLANGEIRKYDEYGDLLASAENPGITVSGNATDGWVYTFNNVNFTTTAAQAIYFEDTGATMMLVGDNAVTGGSDSTGEVYGIYANDSLTIDGDGSLSVTAGNGEDSYGISARRGLTVENGDINITTGNALNISYGIYARGGDSVVIKGGNITATAGDAPNNNSYGVYAYNSMIVEGGSLKAYAGNANTYAYGIYADVNLNISGGKVYAEAKNGTYSYGIYNRSYGNAAMNITGGTVTGVGNTAGIYSENPVLAANAPLAGSDSKDGTGAAAITDWDGMNSTKVWMQIAEKAVTAYDLWVGGVQVTSENASAITGSGITGTVTYDEATHTLTLSDAVITGTYSGVGILNGISGVQLNIVFDGECAIDVSDTNSSISVRTYGSLSFTAKDADASLLMRAQYDLTYNYGGITLYVDGLKVVGSNFVDTLVANMTDATIMGGYFIANESYALSVYMTPASAAPAHTHCECGAETVCDGHSAVIYLPWDPTAKAPENGNWYLADDVTLIGNPDEDMADFQPDDWFLDNGQANLCLNGHTLSVNGSIQISGNTTTGVYGALNICDCGEDGTVQGDGSSAVIWMSGSTTLNLYGGNISGGGMGAGNGGGVNVTGGPISNPTVFNMYGGSICNNDEVGVSVSVFDSTEEDAIFNMYGGSITGNTSVTTGGVNVSGGSFYMYDGSITNNIAEADPNEPNFGAGSIGGVSVGTECYFSMYGGSITGNTGDNIGGLAVIGYVTLDGAVNISGNTAGGENSDIAIVSCTMMSMEPNSVYVGDEFSTSAPIGVSILDMGMLMESPYTTTFTPSAGEAISNGSLEDFVSDSADFVLTDEDGILFLSDAPTHSHEGVTGGFTEITDWTQLETSGNYYLGDTIPTDSGDITIANGVEIYLCLDGKTLDLGNKYIENSGTLTICDCRSAQGSIISTHRVATIYNSGTLSVTGGIISNNCVFDGSAGIINTNNGTLSFGGTAEISNTGEAWINGIDIEGGAVTISGGSISCAGKNSLAVNNAGDVTVTGGTISGQTGIYNEAGGTAAVNGDAQIHGRSYSVLNYGEFVLTSGNLVSDVYGIANYGTLIINDGAISTEHAAVINSGIAEIKGGALTSLGYYSIDNDNVNAKCYLSGSPVLTTSSHANIFAGDGEIFARDSANTIPYSGNDLTVRAYGASEGKVVIKDVNEGNKGKFNLKDTASGYVLILGGDDGDDLILHKHAYTAAYDNENHWQECSCGDKKNIQTHNYTGDNTCSCGLHSHDSGVTVFEKLTATSGALASGNYYLSGNVTATGNIIIETGETVTLCLNGKTLDLGSYRIETNGALTICDCSSEKTGKLTSASMDETITVSGSFELLSGTVIATNGDAIAVDVPEDGITYTTVTGGTVISANGDGISSFAYDNGVSVVEVTGGSVSGKSAITANYATTIIVGGNATLTGTEAYGVSNSGKLYLSGTPSISGADSDVYSTSSEFYAESDDADPIPYSGGELTVKVNLLSNGRSIVKNVTEENKGSFKLSQAGGYMLVEGENGLVLHIHAWSSAWTTNETHHWHECENDYCDITEAGEKNGYAEHDYSEGNTCECTLHTHDGGATVFEKLTATSGALASGNYYLSGNVTATGQITVANGETVTLCLCGNTLDLGSYNIDNRGTLTIVDCKTPEGTISSANSSGGIIYNRGILTINAGNVKYTGSEEYATSISNEYGQTTVNGGNIDGIIDNYAVFILEGGNITNSGEYSAIQNSDGVVIVNGGTIENDYLGIFNYCGHLYVSGGSITSTECAAISNYDGYTYIYGTPVISGNEEIYADIVQHYSDYAFVYAQSEDGVTAYTGETLTVAFDYDGSYEVGNIAIAGVDATTANKFTLLGNKLFKLELGTGDNSDKLVVAYADLTPPTITFNIGDVSFTTLPNADSIGYFVKNDIETSGIVKDEEGGSGIKSIHSYASESFMTKTELEALAETDWNDFNENLQSIITGGVNGHIYIYIRAIDNAGNVTYIGTGKIVSYTDSEAETASVTYTLTTMTDTTVKVMLNGNTVDKVMLGANIVDSSNYTVDTNGNIVFKGAYLDTLASDTYTITVYYDPMGVDYNNAGEAPAATTCELKVEKAEAKIENILDISKTYDGNAVSTPTYILTSDGSASVAYKVKGADDATYTTVAPKDAGEYTVRVSVPETDIYKAASETADFTISKATVTKPDADNTTYTYTGKEQIYNIAASELYTVTGNKRTDAGEQEVTVALKDKDNYTWTDGTIADIKFTFAIGNATFTAEVEQNGTLTYNGEEQEATVQSTQTGVMGGMSVTYQYGLTADDCNSTSIPAFENAGSYTVYFVASADNHNDVKGSFKVVISPKEIVIDWCEDNFTYNGAEQTVTATYEDVNGTPVSLAVATTGEFKNFAEGGYVFTASFASGETNYKLPSVVTKTYNIKKLDISGATVTLVNDGIFTYNGAEQTVTAESLYVGSHKVAAFSYAGNKCTDAGDYKVTLMAGSSNYTGYVTVEWKILPLDIANAEITLGEALTYNGNEQIQSVASVAINGLTVTYDITGNKATNVGASDYILTVTGTGNFTGTAKKAWNMAKADYDMSGITFVNEEFTYDGKPHSLMIGGALPTGADGIAVTVGYSGSATNVADGEVEVTASFATTSTNYNVPTAMTAKVKINPKDIADAEITLGAALTYTGAAQTQTITSVAVNGLYVTYDVSGNMGTDAGNYELTVTGNGNFKGIAKKAWSIGKATQAKPASVVGMGTTFIDMTDGKLIGVSTAMEYKQAAASAYTSISGSEVTGLASGIYHVRYKADDNHLASEYVEIEVTLGGKHSALITLKSDLTLDKTYDGTAVLFGDGDYTYVGDGKVTVTWYADANGVCGEALTGAPTNAGTYYVGISAGEGAVYNAASEIIKKFVISKAQAEIMVDTADIVKTYGEAWNLPVASTNFGTVTCDKIIGDLVNAGTYTVTYTVVGTDNYNGDTKSVKVVINKATYDMTGIGMADKTVIYNGEAQDLILSGILPEGVTVEYTNNGKVEAGVYTVTATFIYDADNYNAIAPMTATLTINKDEIIDHVGEETGGENEEMPHIIVTTGDGFAPDIEIVITEVSTENNEVKEAIRIFDKVGVVYDVTMQAGGVEIQPDGEITIKLLIPEQLRTKDFRILHNHDGAITEVDYETEGDYAVFTVDSLSEFSFVYYQFPWWILIIAVVILCGTAVGIVICKKKKAKEKAKA